MASAARWTNVQVCDATCDAIFTAAKYIDITRIIFKALFYKSYIMLSIHSL